MHIKIKPDAIIKSPEDLNQKQDTPNTGKKLVASGPQYTAGGSMSQINLFGRLLGYNH